MTAPSLALARPTPPPFAFGHVYPAPFMPAPATAAWIRATFLEETGRLHNADHAHLAFAAIGVVWTDVAWNRQQRQVLGMAEKPMHQGGKWKAGRHDQQLREWFGPGVHTSALPDFVLTLSTALAEADDRTFCAIVEHELYHCGQARDAFGAPRFTKDGRPVYVIRGHDVEEFVPVVQRYGASGAVRALVDAAAAAPAITDATLAGACGTCGGALR